MAVVTEKLREALLSTIGWLEELAEWSETEVDDNILAVFRVVLQSDILTSWLAKQATADVPDGAVRVMQLNSDELAEAERLELNADDLQQLVTLLPWIAGIIRGLFR